jgi:hypothetical protein
MKCWHIVHIFIVRFGYNLAQEIFIGIYEVIMSFTKIAALKALFYLGPFCIFHIYCPICMGFGIRDLHLMLLRICEFSANWHRQGRTFLIGVNEITFTSVS